MRMDFSSALNIHLILFRSEKKRTFLFPMKLTDRFNVSEILLIREEPILRLTLFLVSNYFCDTVNKQTRVLAYMRTIEPADYLAGLVILSNNIYSLVQHLCIGHVRNQRNFYQCCLYMLI